MQRSFIVRASFATAIGLLTVASSAVAARDSSTPPRKIQVVAKRFAYVPSEVTLKKGEPVVLVLTSLDVPHGLKFAELNLDTEIKKSGPSELAFTPAQTGDFVGHCSRFCGSGHGSMTLTLHVRE